MGENRKSFLLQNVYPRLRYGLRAGRNAYNRYMKLRNLRSLRPEKSKVIPDNYSVCNTSTLDSEFSLNIIEGDYPKDIQGSMYIAQCLGSPEAFMVGDTNVIRMDFDSQKVKLKNRFMWTPAAMAKHALKDTKYRFDYMGLMFLSPGLGLYSYTEGMYLLPDGRLAVTSDVDRPWIIDPDTLKVQGPLGKRSQWLPMMKEEAGDLMGQLFAGYSNSHVLYPDPEKDESFLVSYQYKQSDGSHPVRLMQWDGQSDLLTWQVTDQAGFDIEIKQSIHELVFTENYILLADTAFVAGAEMLTPWKNAPLPSTKTIIHVVDRRHLVKGLQKVKAKTFEVDEACIHLIARYDNPDDVISVYMLHTPATNTAEIMKSFDRNLEGELFPDHLTGYGTLPVLDLSSIGKHNLDMKTQSVTSSEYISELPYCFGPYLYTYMGRQVENFRDQDLFVMFKGFSKDLLPKRIYDAYKDVDKRRLDIETMVKGEGIQNNNSICRISQDPFCISDAYILPEKVLLHTISTIPSEADDGNGYILAGIVTDEAMKGSSGHEYWIFDGNNLGKGPLCKLGHESLNNTTLFHTLYLPEKHKRIKKDWEYHIDLEMDYGKEEISQWGPIIEDLFKDLIWPYFSKRSARPNPKVEAKLEGLKKERVEDLFGKEFLMGEAYLDDPANFAEQMVEEAERMWKTTGWKKEYEKMGLIVESKAVSGPFESSGVRVTRSSGIIYASAEETFEMLTSPEGYAVIDPVSDPDDHKKPPLQVYDWKPGSRLEAALARTQIPMMEAAEFVVLNGIDPDRKIFVSKSILHEKVPGASVYVDNEEIKDEGRALNTFAIKVVEEGHNRCRIHCINYADMSGKTGPVMNNLVNTRLFFPPLYKRIAKKMKSMN